MSTRNKNVEKENEDKDEYDNQAKYDITWKIMRMSKRIMRKIRWRKMKWKNMIKRIMRPRKERRMMRWKIINRRKIRRSRNGS